MADSRFEELVQADARLSRSFIAAVTVVVAVIVWLMFLAGPREAEEASGTTVVLMLLQFASYVWYAIAAGGAAKVLGDSGWKYVAWIIAAPVLSRLPIPLVSFVILASPLAIKLLLGSRLQSEIRRESVAVMHGGA